MGLFDKLFGKRKPTNPTEVPEEILEEAEIADESDVVLPEEAAEEPQQEEAPAAEAPVVLDEERQESIRKFRASLRKYFPTSLDAVEYHMQLPYMISSAVDITPVIDYARDNVYSKFEDNPEKLAELSRAAVAKVAMALEKYLDETNGEDIRLAVSRAHSDSLEKAWIVLDFYCQMLKSDYTGNIKVLYDIVTDELIARGSKSDEKIDDESYEDVLAKCSKFIAGGASDEEIFALKSELFRKLCLLDSIYVVHDDTFNSAFPYVGADGRLEIQTNAKRAEALKGFIEGKGDSRVTIREYTHAEFDKFFSDAIHNGLTVARIDNGSTPVELDIADFYDNHENNLLEIGNRYVRGRFISELQYGYRLKNLLSDKKDSDEYRVLSGAMLEARSKGYRALSGSLVYAFNIGGARNGVTLYTPGALETAKEIMKVMGVIDEDILIAPGDTRYEVFEGELALRAVQKRDTAPGEGLVCAFTDKANADKIGSRFAEGGATDATVIVTLGELCSQCASHAGFILDMTSYGIELPKEMFIKINEYVKTGGLIIAGKEQ